MDSFASIPNKLLSEPQVLWEAWATTLDNAEWAARVRDELDFLSVSSARDRLLQLLSRGPSLFGLWAEWREELRGPAQDVGLLERGQLFLNPDPEFAAHWGRVQQMARHFRSRNAYVQVDAHLLRSPQPRLSGLSYLKDRYALTGLVNLREESQESEQLCRRLELDYHWIPVEDMKTPQPEQVERFLTISQQGVNLVHCEAGQGRTGLFVAAYRIAAGWATEEAIGRTDAEIFSRGMRPGQREWLRQRYKL